MSSSKNHNTEDKLKLGALGDPDRLVVLNKFPQDVSVDQIKQNF